VNATALPGLVRPLDAESLDTVIASGVRAVYQPIVTLATGEIMGYEALARGPTGSWLEAPDILFAQAHAEGRTADLDRACRTAAVDGALRAGLRSPATLFINVEPEVLADDPRGVSSSVRDRIGRETRVFFEVTERALTSHPAELLDAVEQLRGAGFGIALDDLGADRRSLALLPLLRPDVVKLDISLIHNHPSRASGEVMNGVCAYAEQTGAAILAEGIENERHVLAAQSLGATLAQGWHFGRPVSLPGAVVVSGSAAMLEIAPRMLRRSPVALVHARRPLSVGRKDVLLSVSRALEAQALDLGAHAVVVATFQHVRHFTRATRVRYERLAARAAFAAAVGAGMSDPPARGVRGGTLGPDDALLGEWNIAVLGPHFAGALVAHDLGDDGPDRDRRFEFVVTFDRDLVIDVAAALIATVNSTRVSPPTPAR
jgi:EAL domain-containing protein (putative c-di-GMP-specific phosphodiesterase class I)